MDLKKSFFDMNNIPLDGVREKDIADTGDVNAEEKYLYC
jgi:hypothetical protein